MYKLKGYNGPLRSDHLSYKMRVKTDKLILNQLIHKRKGYNHLLMYQLSYIQKKYYDRLRSVEVRQIQL